MKLVIKSVKPKQILRLKDAENRATDRMGDVDLFNCHLLGVIDHHDYLINVDVDVALEQLDRLRGLVEELEYILEQHEAEVPNFRIVIVAQVDDVGEDIGSSLKVALE
jgi:hypothetical protein